MNKILNQYLDYLVKIIFRIKRKIIHSELLFPYPVISILDDVYGFDLKYSFQKIPEQPSYWQIYNPAKKIKAEKNFAPRNEFLVKNVHLNTINGGVFTRGRQLLLESTIWPEHLHLKYRVPDQRLLPILPINTTFEKAICLPATGNYYHWLVEELPSFLILNSRYPDMQILTNKVKPDYLLSFIEQFKLSIINVEDFVNVTEYRFVQKAQDSSWPNPNDLQILRNHFLNDLGHSNKYKNSKVYISRIKSTRSPKFEKALVDRLKEKGWSIIEPGSLSLFEQVEIFASAKVIAGIHGAGLTGVVWANPGTKVIELCNELWKYPPIYSRISSMLGLDYNYLGYSGNHLDRYPSGFDKFL